MKKRQKKKVIYRCVRALNNKVSEFNEWEYLSKKKIIDTTKEILKSKRSINCTVRDYKKYISSKFKGRKSYE